MKGAHEQKLFCPPLVRCCAWNRPWAGAHTTERGCAGLDSSSAHEAAVTFSISSGDTEHRLPTRDIDADLRWHRERFCHLVQESRNRFIKLVPDTVQRDCPCRIQANLCVGPVNTDFFQLKTSVGLASSKRQTGNRRVSKPQWVDESRRDLNDFPFETQPANLVPLLGRERARQKRKRATNAQLIV